MHLLVDQQLEWNLECKFNLATEGLITSNLFALWLLNIKSSFKLTFDLPNWFAFWSPEFGFRRHTYEMQWFFVVLPFTFCDLDFLSCTKYYISECLIWYDLSKLYCMSQPTVFCILIAQWTLVQNHSENTLNAFALQSQLFHLVSVVHQSTISWSHQSCTQWILDLSLFHS